MKLCVIPSRWASSRFPGKPLHLLIDKPLIEHVWQRAQACDCFDEVLIATDDQRIQEVAKRFGARVAMTSTGHESGTDRIAEAAEAFPEAEIIVNIQGDEPLVSPHLVQELVAVMEADAELAMATAASAIEESADRIDPNVVKVVMDKSGHALYFSRCNLPYMRTSPPGLRCYRHHGIYAYRHGFLRQFVQWEPTLLERAESLEQLRALEHGARIRVLITEEHSLGLDTPEQVEVLEALLRSEQARR